MAGEAEPSELLRVSLWFPVEQPFGVLDYATEDAVYESPFLAANMVIEGEEHQVFMHWFNSTVRKFKQSPESAHIDFRTDDGTLKGVRLPMDYIELMQAYHYPTHTSPFIDPASANWLASTDASHIDDEWESLDGD